MIAKELGLNRGNACIHLEKSPEIGRSRRRMPIDAAYDKYIETSKRMRVAILYVYDLLCGPLQKYIFRIRALKCNSSTS